MDPLIHPIPLAGWKVMLQHRVTVLSYVKGLGGGSIPPAGKVHISVLHEIAVSVHDVVSSKDVHHVTKVEHHHVHTAQDHPRATDQLVANTLQRLQ